MTNIAWNPAGVAVAVWPYRGDNGAFVGVMAKVIDEALAVDGAGLGDALALLGDLPADGFHVESHHPFEIADQGMI